MKTLIAIFIMLASVAVAAPTPYPLTVNSQNPTMPELTVYRGGEQVFALTFKDGATVSDLTGHSVWMSWSTNSTAATCATAVVAVVTATSGTARATFSAASMNYTPGRYVYEVGVITGGTTRVYRHGVLVIRGSPYATGAAQISWSTNLNWGLYTYTGTATNGPYWPGSNVSFRVAAVGGRVYIDSPADVYATVISNAFVAQDTVVSNAFVTQDGIVSNALVAQIAIASNGAVATAAADATAKASVISNAFGAADTVVSNAFVVQDGIVSNGATATARGYDTIVSNAFGSADTVISNAFVTQDTVISNAFVAQDTIVSNGATATARGYDTIVSNAFGSADTVVSNKLNMDLTNHTASTGTSVHGLGTVVTNAMGAFATAAQGVAATNAQDRVAQLEDGKCWYTPPSMFVFDGTNTITDYIGSRSNEVRIPPTINGMAITRIGAYAFAGQAGSPSSVVIPDSVTDIGESAWDTSQLSNLVVGIGVTNIGPLAFTDIDNASIYFRGNAPHLDNAVFSEFSGVLYYLQGRTGFTNGWSGVTQTTWVSADSIYSLAVGTNVPNASGVISVSHEFATAAQGTAAYAATNWIAITGAQAAVNATDWTNRSANVLTNNGTVYNWASNSYLWSTNDPFQDTNSINATIVASNLINQTQLASAIASASGRELFLGTNTTMTGGRVGSNMYEIITSNFVLTNSLSVGTNFVGRWWNTNIARLNADNYALHIDGYYIRSATATATTYFELLGPWTNVLGTSEPYSLTLDTFTETTPHVHLSSNQSPVNAVGINVYVVRSGAAGTASSVIRLNNNASHFVLPGGLTADTVDGATGTVMNAFGVASWYDRTQRVSYVAGTVSNLTANIIRPVADGTNGLVVQDATGTTNIMVIDSLNRYVGFGFQASPIYPFQVKTSTGNEMRFSTDGTLYSSFSIDANYIRSKASSDVLDIKGRSNFNSSEGSAITMANSTLTNIYGAVSVVNIAPIYNQGLLSQGTNTDLLINRSQTSIGSNAQWMINCQTNNISVFRVNNIGGVTALGASTFSNNLTVTGTINTPSNVVAGFIQATNLAVGGYNLPTAPAIGDMMRFDGSRWTATSGFVSRSYPSNVWLTADLTQAGMICDNTVRVWDVSSIVPTNAKSVLLYMDVFDDAAAKLLYILPTSNTTSFVTALLTTQVANVYNVQQVVLPINPDRVLYYRTSFNTFTAIDIVVLGWWY